MRLISRRITERVLMFSFIPGPKLADRGSGVMMKCLKLPPIVYDDSTDPINNNNAGEYVEEDWGI